MKIAFCKKFDCNNEITRIIIVNELKARQLERRNPYKAT